MHLHRILRTMHTRSICYETSELRRKEACMTASRGGAAGRKVGEANKRDKAKKDKTPKGVAGRSRIVGPMVAKFNIGLNGHQTLTHKPVDAILNG